MPTPSLPAPRIVIFSAGSEEALLEDLRGDAAVEPVPAPVSSVTFRVETSNGPYDSVSHRETVSFASDVSVTVQTFRWGASATTSNDGILRSAAPHSPAQLPKRIRTAGNTTGSQRSFRLLAASNVVRDCPVSTPVLSFAPEVPSAKQFEIEFDPASAVQSALSVENGSDVFKGTNSELLDNFPSESGYLIDPPIPHKRKFGARELAQLWIQISQRHAATFWSVVSVVELAIALWNLLVTPVATAFFCDLPSWCPTVFCLLDILKVVVVVALAFRPEVNEYGELAHDWRIQLVSSGEKRRWQALACFPFDWCSLVFFGQRLENLKCRMVAVYLLANGKATLSVLEHETITGISYRALYNASDFPLPLSVFYALRFLRVGFAIPTVRRFFHWQIPCIPRNVGSVLKCLILVVFVSHNLACCFWAVDVHLTATGRFADHYLLDRQGVPTSFAHRFVFNYYMGQRSVFMIKENVNLMAESLMQCVELLVTSLTFHALFGQLIPLVKSLDDQAEYQKILHSREAYLNFMREHMVREEFPATLQGRILLQERFEFSWHQGLDIGKLLSDLPVSLHHDVLRHLYWDMFAKVPMFKDSDEAFQLDLMKRLTTVTLPANFYVCKFGDLGVEMFFIRHGTCNVLPVDESTVLATLGEGSFFGEIALLEDCKRTATIKTATETQLCVLTKPNFHATMIANPATANAIYRAAKERRRADQLRHGLLPHAVQQFAGDPIMVRIQYARKHHRRGGPRRRRHHGAAVALPKRLGGRRVASCEPPGTLMSAISGRIAAISHHFSSSSVFHHHHHSDYVLLSRNAAHTTSHEPPLLHRFSSYPRRSEMTDTSNSTIYHSMASKDLVMAPFNSQEQLLMARSTSSSIPSAQFESAAHTLSRYSTTERHTTTPLPRDSMRTETHAPLTLAAVPAAWLEAAPTTPGLAVTFTMAPPMSLSPLPTRPRFVTARDLFGEPGIVRALSKRELVFGPSTSM